MTVQSRLTVPGILAAFGVALGLAPASADVTTTRFGVAGDSLTDEYFDQGACEYPGYTLDALNWVQQLAAFRRIDFGPLETTTPREVPRCLGYERDWARAGADTATLLDDGQHTGLAAQLASDAANLAVLWIGNNDFAWYFAIGQSIYDGSLSGQLLQDHIDGVVARVDTALAALRAEDVPVLLGKIIMGPGPESVHPDPVGRQRVLDAVAAANAGIEALAAQYPGVAFVDPLALFASRLNPEQTAYDVGGVSIDIDACDEATCAIVSDAIHPGSVSSGLVANAFLEAANREFGTRIPLFSDLELLQIADEFDPSPAIDVPDLDASGIWQLSVDCGGEFTATAVGAFAQDPVTNEVTVGVLPLCGYLALVPDADPTPLTSCSLISPAPHQVDGTRISGPIGGGYTLQDVTLGAPAYYPGTACDGNPYPIGRIVIESRLDAGWITGDDGTAATRIDGISHRANSTLYNTNGDLCTSGPLSPAFCAVSYRPAGVFAQGTPQTVEPRDGTRVTFEAVSATGAVLVTPVLLPAGPLPAPFEPATAVAVEIETDATFSGPVTVCLAYPDEDNDGRVDGTSPPIPEWTLSLYHEGPAGLEDVTTSRNFQAKQVCGQVSEPSRFFLAGAAGLPTPALGPVGLVALVLGSVGVARRFLRRASQ